MFMQLVRFIVLKLCIYFVDFTACVLCASGARKVSTLQTTLYITLHIIWHETPEECTPCLFVYFWRFKQRGKEVLC